MPAFRNALAAGRPTPERALIHPGCKRALRVRFVAPALPRPAFIAHPRLRRTSPISQYAVAAALEALGDAVPLYRKGGLRLGIIVCAMCGCVNYSRRFWDETLKDPALASPLLFPETVLNAPASHLAAFLETSTAYYSLVGDPGVFLQGLAMAADWLLDDYVEGCLVIGTEEMDWLAASAAWLFDRDIILSEGAGALFLRRSPPQEPGALLHAVTDAHPFTQRQNRAAAAHLARADLGPGQPDELLCDGIQGARRTDLEEVAAWCDWTGPRLSVKRILGEGLAAAAAWQCVAAVDSLAKGRFPAATVSVVGCNQQAIAARFASSPR